MNKLFLPSKYNVWYLPFGGGKKTTTLEMTRRQNFFENKNEKWKLKKLHVNLGGKCEKWRMMI